jgi:hypothetical protein
MRRASPTPSFIAVAFLAASLACDRPAPEAAAGAPTEAIAPEETDPNGVDVTLRPYIGRLVTVDATIGSDTLRLILDTGGGDTVIDPRVAQRIGCSPSGRGIGYRMSGDTVVFRFCPSATLHVGGVPLRHERIGVWDIRAALPEGVPPVDGVLSLKSFADRAVTLRLDERVLTVETPASLRTRTASMALLRSRFATGHDGATLTALVRGTAPDTAWYLLDSGNLDHVLVASGRGAASARPDGSSWEDTLALDGLPGRPAVFRAHEIIYDGVLSEEWMARWTWTFDLAGGEVWAAPASGSVRND